MLLIFTDILMIAAFAVGISCLFLAWQVRKEFQQWPPKFWFIGQKLAELEVRLASLEARQGKG